MYTTMPYHAHVAWPLEYDHHNQLDWVNSVLTVEQWLEHTIGPCRQRWQWQQWTLNQRHLCSVEFDSEPLVTMFLLRFS